MTSPGRNWDGWLDGRPRASTLARATFAGLTLVGIGVSVLIMTHPFEHGVDAIAYWTLNLDDPYRGAAGNIDALGTFRYTPPIALAFAPFGLLPWSVFITGWTLLLLASLYWMTGRAMFVFMALYPVAMEVSAGNVNLLIAAAVVIGFRYPASWAFVLLTKVTPGIGLVWFAVRKEWRSLAIATGATALLIGISLVFVPQLWPEWFATVTSEVGADSPGAHVPIPLVIRLPIAGALVAWGARTDRRWVVPIAVTLAVPTIWPAVLSILVGSFALSTIHSDDVPAQPRSVDLDPGRIAVPIQAEVDAGS